MESGIREAMARAEKDGVTITPKVDTRPMHESLRRAGSEMSTTADKIGAAIGLDISNAITGPISAGKWLDTKAFHAAGSLIGKTLKGAIIGEIVGIGAAIGTTLFQGLEKIKAVEETKTKIEALTGSAKTAAAAINSVQEATAKTTYRFGEMADLAVKAVTAGVDPGKDLVRFLNDVQDVAAITGQEIEQVGTQFVKAAAGGAEGGQIMSRQINTLASQGIPVLRWLAREYGYTEDRVKEMVKNGEVDLAHFETVIETHMGNAAEKMAGTFTGQVEVMKKKVGGIGADLIAALFGGDMSAGASGAANAVKIINDRLVDLDNWVKAHSDDIAQFAGNLAAGFQHAAANAARFAAMLYEIEARWERTPLAKLLNVGNPPLDPEQAERRMRELREWADSVDQSSQNTRDAAEKAAQYQRAIQDLGGAVKDLMEITPDGIILKGPSQEDLNKINQAKYDIEAIPGTKDFKLVPKTVEAVQELQEFVRRTDSAAWFEVHPRIRMKDDPAVVFKPLTDWLSQPLSVSVAMTPTSPGNFIFPGAATPGNLIGPSVATPGTQQPTLAGAPGLPGAGGGQSLPGMTPQGGGGLIGPGVNQPIGAAINSVATSMGLTMTSGQRGPQYPGDKSYHISGRAMDFSGTPQQMAAFANYMIANYGSQLKELIYSGAAYNVLNGVLGPAIDQPGSAYSSAQAGYHGDHVHVAFQSGGGITGFGRGDKVPILAEPGEHMLTRDDVAAMGGQAGVYAFRRALHAMQTGGMVRYPPEWFGPVPPQQQGSGQPSIISEISSGLQPVVSNAISIGRAAAEGAAQATQDTGEPMTPTGPAPGPTDTTTTTTPSTPSGPSGTISLPFGITIPYGQTGTQAAPTAEPTLEGPHGQGITPPSTPVDVGEQWRKSAESIPGLWGLGAILAGSDDAAKQKALADWTSNTIQWLVNWGSNTIQQAGTIGWQGITDALGLGGLGPGGTYASAAMQIAQYYGRLGSQVANANQAPGTGGYTVDANGNIVTTAPGATSPSSILAPQPPSGVPGSPANRTAAALGLTGNEAVVYDAMIDAGFPATEWPALRNLLMSESGFNPTARNPSSGAFGLFQFYGHQNDKYGALGAYSSDAASQARAGLQYIKDRYGSPSAAWAHWQTARSYDVGGWLPPGMSIAINTTGKPEAVIPSFQTGGDIWEWYRTHPQGTVPTPPNPRAKAETTPPINKAAEMAAPPSIPVTPVDKAAGMAAPPPSPGVGEKVTGVTAPPGTTKAETEAPPAVTPPVAEPERLAPAPIEEAPTGQPPEQIAEQGPAGPAPVTTGTEHLLPAFRTGIESGFAAVGNIVSQIAGAATSAGIDAGTMGAGAPAAGIAGSAVSSAVSGAFQQAAHIATGLANVVSSLGVGTLTMESPYGASGQTYAPAQYQAALPSANSHITNNYGQITVADPQALRRELDLRDAQHFQSIMAGRI